MLKIYSGCNPSLHGARLTHYVSAGDFLSLVRNTSNNFGTIRYDSSNQECTLELYRAFCEDSLVIKLKQYFDDVTATNIFLRLREHLAFSPDLVNVSWNNTKCSIENLSGFDACDFKITIPKSDHLTEESAIIVCVDIVDKRQHIGVKLNDARVLQGPQDISINFGLRGITLQTDDDFDFVEFPKAKILDAEARYYSYTSELFFNKISSKHLPTNGSNTKFHNETIWFLKIPSTRFGDVVVCKEDVNLEKNLYSIAENHLLNSDRDRELAEKSLHSLRSMITNHALGRTKNDLSREIWNFIMAYDIVEVGLIKLNEFRNRGYYV